MPYVVAKYHALLEQGATHAALKLRWFETTWDSNTLDVNCERWMVFCQNGNFKLNHEEK